MIHLKKALTASTIALSLACAPATLAGPKKPKQSQPAATTTTTGGTHGGVTGDNLSVGTSGTGAVIPGGTAVSGTADATAEDGTVNTRIDAKSTEKRSRLRATAAARTEEERARSRTQTNVMPNQTIRSRTTTMYKEQGSKPVRETVTTIVCADGRVVEKMKGCNAPN